MFCLHRKPASAHSDARSSSDALSIYSSSDAHAAEERHIALSLAGRRPFFLRHYFLALFRLGRRDFRFDRPQLLWFARHLQCHHTPSPTTHLPLLNSHSGHTHISPCSSSCKPASRWSSLSLRRKRRSVPRWSATRHPFAVYSSCPISSAVSHLWTWSLASSLSSSS